MTRYSGKTGYGRNHAIYDEYAEDRKWHSNPVLWRRWLLRQKWRIWIPAEYVRDDAGRITVLKAGTGGWHYETDYQRAYGALCEVSQERFVAYHKERV